MTSNTSDDILTAEIISNIIFHILTPRTSRNKFNISVSSQIPEELMHMTIKQNIKYTMESSYVGVLEINTINTDTDNTTYEVIYITIPNELIRKLYNAGVKNCRFYIGLSEDERQYSILNGPPTDDQIALTTYDNSPCTYMSNIITLEEYAQSSDISNNSNSSDIPDISNNSNSSDIPDISNNE